MRNILINKLNILAICCVLLILIGLILDSVIVAAQDTENDDVVINEAVANEQQRASSHQQSSTHTSRTIPTSQVLPTLDSNSVVLITGAAGFIGSELALSLKRIYNVNKLLLVDTLGIDSDSERMFIPTPKNNKDGNDGSGRRKAIYEKLSEEELSTFEFKRQRAFRIFHELTASDYYYMDDHYDDGSSSSAGVSGSKEDRRASAPESIRFYRADMRPSIPEFFDFGEVPLLEGIFMSHPDITHVVHLADDPVSGQNQAIPRNKDSVKTGRMEGLLEEFRLMIERSAASDGSSSSTEVRLPHFVYASSHEVYDRFSATTASSKDSSVATPQQPNPPPFQEDRPITTPSSLHGTAKLIDEVLASAYHSTHGIYSVGLRFFNVYGPWNSPGTDVFDLAERISSSDSQEDEDSAEQQQQEQFEEDINDYIYIDDAVDAILSAMQYRPPGVDSPPPVVFNVGSGEGHTLKELKDKMSKHFPNNRQTPKANPKNEQRQASKSVASISRSESLLGFRAQVPLEEGLAHTLTWHRDRTFPYGRDPTIEQSVDIRIVEEKISESLAISRRTAEDEESNGECSLLDRDCLRGAPVFPCASECRRSERCTPSVWDDVSVLSRMITTGCDAVLYTILLDDTAEQIPSATASVSLESMPYVGAGLPDDVGARTQARCNIAFVSDKSPLVKRLKSEGEEYVDEETSDGSSGNNKLPPLLRHGFWTVLPVSTPSSLIPPSWMHAFDGSFSLKYLPKISPGRFFGYSVRYAAYTDPFVYVENLPELLKKMEDGPLANNRRRFSTPASSTAMMLALKKQTCDPAQRGSSCADTYTRPPPNDALQSHAYNMIRMALLGDLLGGGLESTLDSSLVIHSLKEEDSRLFRCDVYGETAQWGVSSDERSLEFIISLHDLWSRAVVHWSTGLRPWWLDAGNYEEGETPIEGNIEEEGTWMGVLSSTDRQLFTHIIPADGNGIVRIEL